jgi:uncharacterized protein with NRDE domain
VCLIVLAWRQHPEFPLVLAANRDEYHARPAAPMGWWEDPSDMLAGRDLKAGGTWLGLSRAGRLGAITNYREDSPTVAKRSRGEIITEFVRSRKAPSQFLDAVDPRSYAGFSSLACDGAELAYGSNRGDSTRALDPGVYGLSNASLDTPWSKLVRSRDRLEALLRSDRVALDQLLDLMADREPAQGTERPESGLPFELDRALSAPFIVMPEYGTRCTTAVICRSDGHVEIVERRFDAAGEFSGESRFVLIADAWKD